MKRFYFLDVAQVFMYFEPFIYKLHVEQDYLIFFHLNILITDITSLIKRD